MRLFEYRIRTKTKYDDNAGVIEKPATLVSGEEYYLDATDAREELLMHEAAKIEEAGGRKAVLIEIRPFLRG